VACTSSISTARGVEVHRTISAACKDILKEVAVPTQLGGAASDTIEKLAHGSRCRREARISGQTVAVKEPRPYVKAACKQMAVQIAVGSMRAEAWSRSTG